MADEAVAGLQRLESKVDDLLRRLSALEKALAQVRAEVGAQSARVDRIEKRLKRIDA